MKIRNNDCKDKEVENITVDYCNASTLYEDEWISQVVCGTIDNSSGWQNGVADYTDLSTSIGAGMAEEITVYNGTPYASDAATVWVDWNDDYVFELGGDEEFVLTSNGTGALFTGAITVPGDAADGMHRMRIRLVYNSSPNPCDNSSYGEIEDYSILVADPTYGNLEGTVTDADGGAAIEGATVMVDDETYTTGADGMYSFTDLLTGTKTVTCIADGYYEAIETVLVEEGLTATLDFELSGILYGTLEGTVTDGSTAIENATVSVEMGSGNYITATTGADGMYSITDIEVGSYDISCVATGYSFEYETGVLIEGGLSTTVDFVLEETGIIPQNFSATVVDVTDVLLEWESPAGALMVISQNDGEAANVYANYFLETGYGVVYDLSDYPGATLELVDFYTYTGGVAGTWDYKVHIVDWETHTAIAELGPFQTTVSDDWEQNIYIGSYPAGISGVIAILIEPMSSSGGEVYPQIPVDNALNGTSVYGPMSDFNAFGPAGDDFLIDLWIISPNGKKKLKADKISTSKLISDKESKALTPIENTGQTFNKKGNGSKDFIGFNAYRDDELIAENLVLTHFLDENLSAGTYIYDVKAVYDEGLSEGAGPLTVTIGGGIPRDLVVIEVGTGTWCVFCPGAAMGVDEMHEEGLSVGVIEYHSGDAYSTSEGELRLSYYGVSAYPTAIFDGLEQHAGGSATNSLYGTYLPKYEYRMGVPSLFELESTYENIAGDNYQLTVDAEMIEEYQGVNNDIVLQVVLTESHIPENWQNQTELNFVCRDVIPDENGTSLDFAGSATQSVQLDFTIPSEYEMENIELIVYIQDNASKEILQATESLLSSGPQYCDASTTNEDEYIANVLCGTIDNSSEWQGGVADYTAISTTIATGMSEDIIVTNGTPWAADEVHAWVDWDMNYDFGIGGDEEFVLVNDGTGTTFTGAIAVPAGTPDGDYLMRLRMVYSETPVPCGESSYGEVEDYTITVGGSSSGPCENFDALTAGGLVAEQLGGMWTTWSGTSADDATVSDMYSNSPSNSFVVDAGSVDLVRKFDDVAIDAGQWLYSNYIYVPTGFSGYFNVQSDPAPGVAWVVDLFFDDGGTGSFGTSATSTFTYAQDTWILVEINFDLDADFAEVYFDGALMTVFAWDGTIGGIDYYGYDVGGAPGAYYDDVCFDEGWVYTSVEEQMTTATQMYPNPATDKVNIVSDFNIESITVYNFAGQVVLTEAVNNTTYRVNTSNFDTGIYLFQIETKEGRIAKRIIIE